VASVGHVAVGFALARWEERRGGRAPLALSMVAWATLALLPDADAVGFALGIDYGAEWGHRGASHSLAFALAVAAAVAGLARRDRARKLALAAIAVASHGLLDTLTDGGLGVALLWPFSDERFFAPWRPIPVAPIGLAYFSGYGLSVALTETLLFAPLLIYALLPRQKRPEGRP
jgi:inner membrane protein